MQFELLPPSHAVVDGVARPTLQQHDIDQWKGDVWCLKTRQEEEWWATPVADRRTRFDRAPHNHAYIEQLDVDAINEVSGSAPTTHTAQGRSGGEDAWLDGGHKLPPPSQDWNTGVAPPSSEWNPAALYDVSSCFSRRWRRRS